MCVCVCTYTLDVWKVCVTVGGSAGTSQPSEKRIMINVYTPERLEVNMFNRLCYPRKI